MYLREVRLPHRKLVNAKQKERGKGHTTSGMTGIIPHSNASGDSYARDQVIQETPVADQIIGREETATPIARGSIERGLSGERGHKRNQIGVYNSFQHSDEEGSLSPAEEVAHGWMENGNDSPPTKGFDSSTTNDKKVKYNTRTPNLDKIAKFFMDNKSPGAENLLAKFESAQLEDTPLSKRSEYLPTLLSVKKKISCTEFIAATQSEEDKISIEITEARLSAEAATIEAGGIGKSSRKMKSSKEDVSSLTSNGILDSVDAARLLCRTRARTSSCVFQNAYDRGITNEQEVIGSEISKSGYMSMCSTPRDPDTEYPESKDRNCIQIEEPVDNLNSSHPGPSIRGEVNAKESSVFGPSSNSLHTAGNENRYEEVSIDPSRIDDTTDGNISPKWVLRPNISTVFNSNKSTQLINITETQDVATQVVEPAGGGSNESFLGHSNGTQTQVIVSYLSQRPFSQSRSDGFLQSIDKEPGALKPVLKSPEQTFLSPGLETPLNITNNIFEPVMEVPETSSASKARSGAQNETNDNSSPTPKDKDSRKDVTQTDDSQEKVLLQISSKPEHVSSQESDEHEALDTNRDVIVVMSEAELTQELPEMDEENAQESLKSRSNKLVNLFCNDFQNDQSQVRRKRGHVETVEITAEEENRSGKPSPKKKLRRIVALNGDGCKSEPNGEVMEYRNDDRTTEQAELEEEQDGDPNGTDNRFRSTDIVFPETILRQDDEFLSKKDIKFEDAVWCQYDLDYKYYPGRVSLYDEDSESCRVNFDTGKFVTKNDDIYYLDVRVGDSVSLNGKRYEIIALQCRSHDLDLIRCIRGYDTVHLKRKNTAGKLGKKTLIKPLGAISIDLNEWTRRPKVILEDGSHTRAKAFKDLQRPIRGRKNVITVSPRKGRKEGYIERPNRPIYKEDSEGDNDIKDGITYSSISLIPENQDQSHELNAYENKKIFDKCLFVLTGLNEDSDKFCEVINSQGGEVLDLGFSSLFESESLVTSDESGEAVYPLNLSWKKNSKFKDYKFACLITKQHLRSLKYLETLALGWPTLHWKFIRECLHRGRLSFDIIYQYLLPSGESYRLLFNAKTRTGVIKSSNIFQFYSKLLDGCKLYGQLDAMSTNMSNYTVILYGHSELDKFIEFTLTCLGVKQLYQVSRKITATAAENLGVVMKILEQIIRTDEDREVLIYVNKTSGISSDLLEKIRKDIMNKFENLQRIALNVHVESKEWLIQTVINGSTGFDEIKTPKV